MSRDYRYKDNTVVWPITYTGKITSLYWNHSVIFNIEILTIVGITIMEMK